MGNKLLSFLYERIRKVKHLFKNPQFETYKSANVISNVKLKLLKGLCFGRENYVAIA